MLTDAQWEAAVQEVMIYWSNRFPRKWSERELRELAEHDVLVQISEGAKGTLVIEQPGRRRLVESN